MSIFCTVFVASLVTVASSAQGATEVVRHVMGAGGMGGQAPSSEVRSTFGQAVVGEATSASYRIQSGFWLPGGTTSGVDDQTADLPPAFDLGRFVPNPFNGTTRISYAVPAVGGNVKISVFDVTGALVRVLAEENVAPGNRTLTWDGKSEAGRQVASGIYLVQMEAAGFKATRKLMLMR